MATFSKDYQTLPGLVSDASYDVLCDTFFNDVMQTDPLFIPEATKPRVSFILTPSGSQPTSHAILFGRGGATNKNPGNVNFRNEILRFRDEYMASSKQEKFEITLCLVRQLEKNGYRFLKKGTDGLWHDVDGKSARKKVSQSLREVIPSKRGDS